VPWSCQDGQDSPCTRPSCRSLKCSSCRSLKCSSCRSLKCSSCRSLKCSSCRSLKCSSQAELGHNHSHTSLSWWIQSQEKHTAHRDGLAGTKAATEWPRSQGWTELDQTGLLGAFTLVLTLVAVFLGVTVMFALATHVKGSMTPVHLYHGTLSLRQPYTAMMAF
jgi:hypothetical protein